MVVTLVSICERHSATQLDPCLDVASDILEFDSFVLFAGRVESCRQGAAITVLPSRQSLPPILDNTVSCFSGGVGEVRAALRFPIAHCYISALVISSFHVTRTFLQ